jgi:hypothetical protein
MHLMGAISVLGNLSATIMLAYCRRGLVDAHHASHTVPYVWANTHRSRTVQGMIESFQGFAWY